METWYEARADLIIRPVTVIREIGDNRLELMKGFAFKDGDGFFFYRRTFEEAKEALIEHKREAVHKAARALERARTELAKAKRQSQLEGKA